MFRATDTLSIDQALLDAAQSLGSSQVETHQWPLVGKEKGPDGQYPGYYDNDSKDGKEKDSEFFTGIFEVFMSSMQITTALAWTALAWPILIVWLPIQAVVAYIYWDDIFNTDDAFIIACLKIGVNLTANAAWATGIDLLFYPIQLIAGEKLSNLTSTFTAGSFLMITLAYWTGLPWLVIVGNVVLWIFAPWTILSVIFSIVDAFSTEEEKNDSKK